MLLFFYNSDPLEMDLIRTFLDINYLVNNGVKRVPIRGARVKNLWAELGLENYGEITRYI